MESYEKTINSAPTVLVEFYASWCPHCKKMMPVVDDVRELLNGTVPVYQFDIDENQETADSLQVESIPTFLIYHNGREMWRYSGEIDGNMLYEKVQSFMK